MSDPTSDPVEQPAVEAQPPQDQDDDKGILLIPYPKFVFFYPTALMAMIAGVCLWFLGDDAVSIENKFSVAITSVFLTIFTVNLVIIVFDFPRSTSLILVLIIATFALGLWLVLLFNPGLVPFLASAISALHPVANSTFYFCLVFIMVVLYIVIYFSVRFDYWELRANELIHHHGIWSDMKRYPAPNLRIDKEVNDIFEHILLGAGRLVLRPTTEERAIVLDNVLFVNQKEEALTKKLGSLKVRIHED